MTIKSNQSVTVMVMAAVALATGLLGLVAVEEPAQATGSGTNGLIAFVSDRDSVNGTPNDDIYVMNPDGSTLARLTTDKGVDQFPAVSPGGNEIVFASTRSTNAFPNPEGDFELYVMDAKDGNEDGEDDNLRRLTNNGVSDTQPAWRHDSNKLAFTRNGEIYVMDANGANEIPLTNNGVFDGQPVFSPDGTSIAFLRLQANNDIYLMKAEPESTTNNVPIRLTNSPASDTQPEFSPEGGKIAFMSNRPSRKPDGTVTSDSDIWVMNTNGPEDSTNNAPTNLTDATDATPPLNDRYPAWSPDGTRIAFWSSTGTGLGSTGPSSEISVMNSDGSGTPTKLTNNTFGDIQPDWGPEYAAPPNTAPGTPGAPTLSSGSAPNAGTFDLKWEASTDSEDDPITYRLEHKDADDTSYSLVSGADSLSKPSYSFTQESTTEGTWTYKAQASDGTLTSNFSEASSEIKVDRSAPTLDACPSQNKVLLNSGTSGSQNVSLTARDPALADGSDGAALDNAASTLSGSIDTTEVGTKQVTFTAVDEVGNQDQTTCDYKVVYDWKGFFSPVDNPDTGKMNQLKAGSAIPLKFSLDGDPQPGSNSGFGTDDVLESQGSAAAPIQTTKINCSSFEADPVPTEYLDSASSTNLSYDPDEDQYGLVWKTDKSWAGTCRQAVLETKDGELHKANFYFTK